MPCLPLLGVLPVTVIGAAWLASSPNDMLLLRPAHMLLLQHRVNSTRLCDHFVSEDCIRHNSPELCIQQEVERLLGEAPAGVQGNSGTAGGAGRAAAIAAPVAVGALWRGASSPLRSKHGLQ